MSAQSVAGYCNAGHDCTAATRVLAGPRVHDDFLSALVTQDRATRIGPSSEEALHARPLSNAGQLPRVEGFLDRVPAHAAGYGKGLSTYGLEDYTRIKHVMYARA